MARSSLCFHPIRLSDACVFLALFWSCTAIERQKVGIAVGHDAKLVRREPRTSERLMDSPSEVLIQAHGLAKEHQADLQPLSGDYSNYPEPDGVSRDINYPSRDNLHDQGNPYGQIDPYPPPVGSYPGSLQPSADAPMHSQPPHMQGSMFGPLNEVEARQEVQKMDRLIAEAEFRAGLPDTTHTTPLPEPGEDIIEKEERTGMYFACLIVLVLGAVAAGYSLHLFQGQKAGIDAAEESGEACAQLDQDRVPEGNATQS